MEIESNGFYYLFSTTAQSFAALAGILAVFVVYALEWIQKSIEWSRADLIQVLQPHTEDRNFKIYNLTTQLDQAESEILPTLKETNKGYEYKKHDDLAKVIRDGEKALLTVREQKKHREEITSRFISLFRMLLILIAVSLSLSALGKTFMLYPKAKWLLFATTVVAAGALNRIFSFVRFALKRPKDAATGAAISNE